MGPTRSTPSFDEPPVDHPSQRRLPPLLRQAWYSLNQAFRRRITHLNLTPDQFTVLRWLHECEDEPITQRRLADLMSSDPNTVTSVLNRMEANGFIKRQPHATDRRAKIVRLRSRGRGIYDEARQIAVDLQHQVIEALPADERDRFLQQLELIANACSDAADQPPPNRPLSR